MTARVLVLLLFSVPLVASHPLDSVTADEIATAAAVCRASPKFVEGTAFAVVSLNEPTKAQVFEGKPIAREAFVVLLDRDHNRTNEVIVDLEGKSIKTWKTIANVQLGTASGIHPSGRRAGSTGIPAFASSFARRRRHLPSLWTGM